MAKPSRARVASASSTPTPAEPTSHRGEFVAGVVRGVSEVIALTSVAPNPWNPNRMTPQMMESLRLGLRTDGWIASQALLVWGFDAGGNKRNVIIDGEHRWRAATAEGYASGPAVFIDGLNEMQAKALTIKMNQKRGAFEEPLLAVVLRELQDSGFADDLGMELGFTDDVLLKLLAEDPLPLDGSAPPRDGNTTEVSNTQHAELTTDPSSNHVRLVQLFFDQSQHAEWMAGAQVLAKAYGTTNVTDTALMALRDALVVRQSTIPTAGE